MSITRHRAAFVWAFTSMARDLGMLLVLDDVMCSVRCGRFFNHQYYNARGAKSNPDHHGSPDVHVCLTTPVGPSSDAHSHSQPLNHGRLIIVGKHWLISTLIQVGRPQGCDTWTFSITKGGCARSVVLKNADGIRLVG